MCEFNFFVHTMREYLKADTIIMFQKDNNNLGCIINYPLFVNTDIIILNYRNLRIKYNNFEGTE